MFSILLPSKFTKAETILPEKFLFVNKFILTALMMRPTICEMDNPKHSLPYEVGKNLILNINQALLQEESTIEVKIVRFIQPSTLSCVMVVESPKYPKHLILKLYDWRYATGMRKNNKVGSWTHFHENSYRAFVENGDAAKFSAAILMKDGSLNNPQDGSWNTAQNEVYLFDQCRDIHKCEIKAYNKLKNLHGKKVPRFFADVHLKDFSTQNSFFEVQGIIIEFIEGYNLSDLAENEPQSAWQNVSDEAIRTVNLIGDYGVLNKDVCSRNVLVKKRAISSAEAPEIIVIDLALCRFREDYTSEAAWIHEKSLEDEEGGIGFPMAHELKGAVIYKPSNSYCCKCSECTI